jgi:hypothetical protein
MVPILSLEPPETVPAAGTDRHAVNPRTLPVYNLYRRFRQIAHTLEEFGDSESVAHYLLKTLVEASSAPGALITGGRAYRCVGDVFELFEKLGESGPVPLGYRVPVSYPVLQDLLRQGWILVRDSDPRFDRAIEGPIQAHIFAAIVIGPSRDHLLSFTLQEPVPDEELIYALVSLRSIADLALRQRELIQFIEQAREIQTSLLPREAPRFDGYDVAFRSRPAMIVGGDIFDFQQVLPSTLGISIGDATGHGLPAALQARDAIVGLRMGVEENLKIVKMIEKLSRVVQAGGSVSRFISLFYTELDRHGNLVYVNAGHVPPLLFRHATGEVVELPSSGPVIGLPVAAHYEQSFERMAPGDVLLLYTDGLCEARNPAGEEHGLERMIAVLRREAAKGRTAREVVGRLFEELDAFTGGALQIDDETAVVVRRVR